MPVYEKLYGDIVEVDKGDKVEKICRISIGRLRNKTYEFLLFVKEGLWIPIDDGKGEFTLGGLVSFKETSKGHILVFPPERESYYIGLIIEGKRFQRTEIKKIEPHKDTYTFHFSFYHSKRGKEGISDGILVFSKSSTITYHYESINYEYIVNRLGQRVLAPRGVERGIVVVDLPAKREVERQVFKKGRVLI